MTPRERRYFLSLVIQLALAPLLVHDWDGFVFTRTVHDFLAGSTPYAVVEADPSYIHIGNTWPPLNTWYAYPPLPLLLMTPTLWLAFGSSAAPWVVRLALKVPFIAGMMLLAWAGEKIARKHGGAAAASEWERMILLNPFLLFVSAAWGMFDAWIVALMLLSLVLADERREWAAGVAFGASALVKLFPLFAAPAFVWYVARRRGARHAARFVLGAVATFIAVSLPFAVGHPRGFLLQVVGMHVRRAPQGLSLLALVSESTRYAAAQGWLTHPVAIDRLSSLTFGLTLGVTVATTAAVAHAKDARHAVSALLGLFLGVLFTSKVLNEQYFVIPVALCALVWCTSRARWALAGFRACTYGALAASLLLGWHVFTFWPPGVAETLFGRRGWSIAGTLASHAHVSPATFGFAPVVLSVIALAPAAVIGTRRIVHDVRAGARLLLPYARSRVALHRLRAVHLLAVLIGVPVLVQASALEAAARPPRPPLDTSHRRLGSFYYLWWANPSHDPAMRDGNWNGVSERPLDGFYTISATKLRNDFRAARQAGIDLMLASFHVYDLPVVPAALDAAYDQDMAIAPLVELGELFGDPAVSIGDGFSLTAETEKAVVDLTSKALAAFADAPAAYRPDGKLAVYFFDSYFAEGKLRTSTRRALVDRVAGFADSPPRAELEATAPKTFEAMLDAAPHADLWRRGYSAMYTDFWKHVRAALEKRFGPLVMMSGESWNTGAPFHRGSEFAIEGLRVFDGSFIYSPSFVWVLHKASPYERNWERWVVRTVLQAQYERGAGHPVVGTVNPTYDDHVLRKKNGFRIPAQGPRGDTYDLSWRLALDERSDMVLVSTWNELFEGSAIEPTTEHGATFLNETAQWSKRLNEHAQPAHRGLVLTAEASTHFHASSADPDVEARYAHDVQVVVARDLPDWVFDAIDVDVAPAHLDLSPYEVVIVEPGYSDQSKALPGIVENVRSWISRGGRALLSNVAATSPWAELAGATLSSAPETATRVRANDGTDFALPLGSRPRTGKLQGQVLLRYADGDERDEPALWIRDVGAGQVAATSFDLAGREPYPGAGATQAFCAAFRALVATAKCGSDRAELP